VRRSLVLAVVAATLASACGGGDPDRAEPTPTGPTGGTGALPRPSPAAGWVGTATFDISGGVRDGADLTMAVGTVALDPEELVVAWTDDAGEHALAILWAGTEPPALGVPIEGFLVTITTPETLEHGSYGDERGGCSVTLDRYGPDGLSGTFDCTDLEVPDRGLPSASATGIFELSRSG
jgi:hypothetical protein